jgi:hypothetical protein
MRHGAGAIRLCGLVLVMLVLTGIGPARSVADGPTLTLADDFPSGPGSVWQLQRIKSDGLKSVPDPAGQDRSVLAITLRTGDMAESGGVGERAELSEANRFHLPTGTDVWYSFQLYIPTDFPVVDRRLVLGQWNQLVYHLKLTPTPDGFLQAWLNGRQVVDYKGSLGYPDDLDSVYFKIGLYRDTLPFPMTIMLGRFRRGATRAEVDPATP